MHVSVVASGITTLSEDEREKRFLKIGGSVKKSFRPFNGALLNKACEDLKITEIFTRFKERVIETKITQYCWAEIFEKECSENQTSEENWDRLLDIGKKSIRRYKRTIKKHTKVYAIKKDELKEKL